MGQLQEAAQPLLLLAAEVLDIDLVLEAIRHRAQHDHHDVLELVQLVAVLPPGIGQLGEVGLGIGRHILQYPPGLSNSPAPDQSQVT